MPIRVFVCIQKCASVCTFECVCRTEVNRRCCSSGAVHLILRVSPHRLKWMVSMCHRPSCFFLPYAMITRDYYHMWLLTWDGTWVLMLAQRVLYHHLLFTKGLLCTRHYIHLSSRMCTDLTPHSVFYRQETHCKHPAKVQGRWCCPGPSLEIMKFALQQET